MTKLQKQVEVAKAYKIDRGQNAGWGVPFPQRVQALHNANASLMDFAFNLVSSREKYFYNYSENEVLQ